LVLLAALAATGLPAWLVLLVLLVLLMRRFSSEDVLAVQVPLGFNLVPVKNLRNHFGRGWPERACPLQESAP
jgi:hypothetical protein